MSILTLIVPAIAVLLIAAPLVSVAQGKVTGKSAIRTSVPSLWPASALGLFPLRVLPSLKLPALLPPSWAPMLRVWASWLPLW